ncbi:LAFE_0B11254g1_1 [Lachancea fermentati]|uniref:LAFE_0B11254g1_1 n=1 Tax=Lachancea fermentati TaxID=4955 RepID=A0A1G4M8Z9_LACFM|nr:LAFE_0B11254g1_1 [Lachancea fermentati]
MTKKGAIEFAVKQIPLIVPLDEDSVRQLCNNILNQHPNDPEAIAQKFLDILGPADMSFSFVLQFNDKLLAKESMPNNNHESESDKGGLKSAKEAKKPLKKAQTPIKSSQSTAKEVQKVVSNEGLEPIKLESNSKPSKRPEKASSPSIPVRSTNVLSRAKISTVEKKPKKSSKAKKIRNLQEIDDVLKVLEIEHSESDSLKYTCNCQGNRHPLFEVVPNCLSCGKIICVREGLHLNNCTFCGTELISLPERSKIIEILNKEKEDLQSKKLLENTDQKPKKTKTYKISSGTGTNLFTAQDQLFDRLEKEKEKQIEKEQKLKDVEEEEAKQKRAIIKDSGDPELHAAQDRLEKLLHFQDTSAERTKIIDNASDFSMDNDIGVWGSAYERALMLKKQQRNFRKWEKMDRARHGRRDKIALDLNIGGDGKVYMTEVLNKANAYAGSDDDLNEISDEDDLNDLEDIKNLKSEISSQNKESAEKLQSNVWDYEKYGKQFQRPKYVDAKASEKADIVEEPTEDKMLIQSHHMPKVQVENNGEDSLEKNILAVL